MTQNGDNATTTSVSTLPILGDGLVAFRVRVEPKEVVFVRGLLEAHEGLAVMFAEKGGDLLLATTDSQRGELAAFIDTLSLEMSVERFTA